MSGCAGGGGGSTARAALFAVSSALQLPPLWRASSASAAAAAAEAARAVAARPSRLRPPPAAARPAAAPFSGRSAAARNAAAAAAPRERLLLSLPRPAAASAAGAAPATGISRFSSPRPLLYHSSASRGSRGEHRRLRDLKKKPDECPFEALGLRRRADPRKGRVGGGEGEGEGEGGPAPPTFREVRAAFLRIAMAHHPDTTDAETEEEVEMHRDVFIRARGAFEKIAEGPGGLAVLKSEIPGCADDGGDLSAAADLEAWFRQETGHAMPFLDLQTLREVAEMTETVGHGLDRDGGMWLLAEMVSDSVKKGAGGGSAASLLRLEAGDDSSSGSGSLGRRRRRRRR